MLFLPSGLGLLILPHFTYDVFWKTGQSTAWEPRSWIPDWIGLSFFVFWIALFRTHRSVLTLTPAEMRVEKRLLGFGFRTKCFVPSQLSDLRFVPSQYSISIEDQSCVQFRVGKGIRSFGVGIGEEEADALIAKMLEVYSFPQCPPV